MNIRDSIAAGELPNETVITTTVKETDEYGFHCNQAGYRKGYNSGYRKGFIEGMVVTLSVGLITYTTVKLTTYIEQKRKKD